MSSEHFKAVEPLVAVAAGSEADVFAAVDQIGFADAAACLFTEWADRCAPLSLPEELALHVRLDWRDESRDHGFVFGPAGMTATPGVPAAAAARVGISLVHLVRLLFGPAHLRESARWTHRMLPENPELPGRDAPRLTPDNDPRPPIGRATQALLGVRQAPALEDLAVRFGSDKWGSAHWYTPHYARHFGPWRDEPVRLLEIGIGGFGDSGYEGGSLHMWQHYFPRGLVFGVDITEKKVTGSRIRTFRGDQNDPEFLARLAAEHGPFDIVIDDGSHRNDHVLTSFDALFPHVRDGGLYVIEDLQSSYWTRFGGTPDGTGATTVSKLKTLIDGLHHQEHRLGSTAVERNVTELHFYHNIAFIRKEVNDECGPAWLRRFGIDPR
ncbi:class I SAM-dependent methyltransferase [Amycolatopsis sp. OK19-0408]|uniref:Class I SAM-dependent methyltransferase n=1 Tax=Amycolatopsis iheyensis TaxID=2945988 RepID=A0A9X2SNA8_9PSEU|nr:class I SAM-dependent methyltransferase [Amycolatopsis iheyensis]MCR6488782.1 class I SAM-dependent methyltransferase [Amycolatopsis iheyensis]